MQKSAFHLAQVFVVLCCILYTTCGRRLDDEGFYPRHYFNNNNRRVLENNVKLALEKLEHAPQLVNNWPTADVELGQVSGLAINSAGQLLVFHRASNVWDVETFNDRNVYQSIGEPPIKNPTILTFNETGELVDAWGENLFHMPHGITVDAADNVWVTDVALHQVLKFSAKDRRTPELVLGEKFVPRDDETHFCKPSAVAVLPNGDFFVADGYCNTRIIKFRADGTRILQIGSRSGSPDFVFNVPHALTLAEDRGLVCVADRERGRVPCFRADNGTYVTGFRSWLIGPRIFSVAYAPIHGGRLYVVNGRAPLDDIPIRGYVIDFTTGRLIETFAPEDGFKNPHDIVTTNDGSRAYVAEIDPYRVYMFADDSLRNESRRTKNVTRVKPTATVELGQSSTAPDSWQWGAGLGGWGAWRGAAGGAAVAGGAVLLVLGALALRSARNSGRKSLTRRRWEYGHGEFKLRRFLERRRFTRVHSDDSDEEPSPMLPPQPAANA